MALVRAERVLETSTTTGTGSLSLGGPVTGYRSFASVMSTNDTCYYAIVAVDSSGRPTGDWETGLGTLTASTTLTRTTVQASSNGGALVTLASGTKQVFLTLTSTEIIDILASIAAKATATKVDVFTGNDTWYKPTGAKFIDIFVIGGGGGGSCGGLTGTTSSPGAPGGGAGGTGLWQTVFYVPADIFPASVGITVGAGGTGAAGRTTSGGTNTGTNGGNSSFGSYISRNGGTASNGSTPGVGVGGAVVSGVAAVGATGSINKNVSWLQATTNGVGSTNFAIGTDGSIGAATNVSGVSGVGGNGGEPTALPASILQLNGEGGPGGACYVGGSTTSTTTIGGDGGKGGYPGGGGGGGGGAAINRTSIPAGSKSGKGGNGADGVVVVVTHF